MFVDLEGMKPSFLCKSGEGNVCVEIVAVSFNHDAESYQISVNPKNQISIGRLIMTVIVSRLRKKGKRAEAGSAPRSEKEFGFWSYFGFDYGEI